MIRQMTKQDIALTRKNQKTDPFLCRVFSMVQMYGAYSFAECWIQIQAESEYPTAYVTKMDGVLSLAVSEYANFDEISSFIGAVGADLIICSEECSMQMGIIPIRTGSILKFNRQPVQAQNITINPPLQEVYKILQACADETFIPPLFEPFYLDMSHRIRHGGAKMTGVIRQEQLIACAMTVAETDMIAIIGGVAVHPDYRRSRFGTMVVRGLLYLCAQQNQKHVYVYCNTSENKQFYQALGFVNYGAWTEIEYI